MSNEGIVRQVALREADRQRREFGSVGSDGIPGIERWVSTVVADVLDIVSQRVPVPPGPCWHDSGVKWPDQTASLRCELLAGHAGAHQADRGPRGGTAVWTDVTLPTTGMAATAAAASELEESK